MHEQRCLNKDKQDIFTYIFIGVFLFLKDPSGTYAALKGLHSDSVHDARSKVLRYKEECTGKE